MKRLSLLLALMLLACLFSPAAMAATSGSCGTNITWKLNTSTKTLTITCNGEGQMNDYNSFSGAPWYSQRANINTVVMTGNVTYIGMNNFYAIDADFTLPDTVATIGEAAFYGFFPDSCRMPTPHLPLRGTFPSRGRLRTKRLPPGGKLAAKQTDEGELASTFRDKPKSRILVTLRRRLREFPRIPQKNVKAQTTTLPSSRQGHFLTQTGFCPGRI